MSAAVDSFNTLEVLLWTVIALLVAYQGQRHETLLRYARQAATLFVLFAISDLVELRTGAWWRPWWLLLWKATCLVGLGVVSVAARRAWMRSLRLKR